MATPYGLMAAGRQPNTSTLLNTFPASARNVHSGAVVPPSRRCSVSTGNGCRSQEGAWPPGGRPPRFDPPDQGARPVSTGTAQAAGSALETTGTLTYEVESLPEPLGYHPNATLWLRAPPRALAATTGNHNLMTIVICHDADDFYRYLSTRLAPLTSIESYAVSVRVRRLKQGALRVLHGRLVRPDHG